MRGMMPRALITTPGPSINAPITGWVGPEGEREGGREKKERASL